MKSKIFEIAKKEIDRFLSNKRMMFIVAFMPGILIFTMYSLIGEGIFSSNTISDSKSKIIYVENDLELFKDAFYKRGFLIKETKNISKSKSFVANGKADLLIIYPENLDETIQNGSSLNFVPNIEVYYNSTSNESTYSYSTALSIFNEIESSVVNLFNVNSENKDYDLSSSKEREASMVSNFLPMMIVMFLFTGCMSVAPESIAGEKERGTLATLLITPIKRKDLAIGKIIGLSSLALLSSLSSFIGIMFALPKMLKSEIEEFNITLYNIRDYIMILFIILSTSLLIIGIVSIVSAVSKNVKEATATISPLMILSTFAGIIPMFSIDLKNIFWGLIPIFNSVLCLNDIFSLEINIPRYIICITSNFIYTIISVYFLTIIFKSEKMIVNH